MSVLPSPGTPYYGGGQVVNPANVIYVDGAPSDLLYRDRPGTIAIDPTNGNAYVLVQVADATAVWYLMGGSSSGFNGLGADSGSATPAGGSILISGGSSGLTTVGSGSTISLTGTLAVGQGGTGVSSLTSHGVLVGGSTVGALSVGATGTLLAGSTGANPAFTGSPSVSGSLTAGTSITATAGNITATNGNLVLSHVGNKLVIAASSNATCSAGIATLADGVAVVSNSAVTTSSLIFVSYNSYASGAGGFLTGCPTPSETGSFTISSSDLTDSSSTVNYLIIN